MAYVRGDKAQFDAWEELGNPGWSWEELWPYFKNVEKMFAPEPWQVDLGASMKRENHGSDGDMHESWAALGLLSANDNMNGGCTRGFEVCPQTIDPVVNQRWDAASAFLWPVADRRNLHLINGTAPRATWASDKTNQDGNEYPRASGVKYMTPDQQVRTISASREVILSAGTFRTPLILERSGVGNRRLLEKLDIDVVVDLPGVGEDLVDQTNTPFMFKTSRDLHGGSPFVLSVTAADLFGANTSHIAAETRRSLHQWAKQVAEANAGMQHGLIFNKGVTLAEIFTTTYAGTVVTTAANLSPFSRGSIHLQSSSGTTDADVRPAIDPKYLPVSIDMETQVAVGRLASFLLHMPPLHVLVVGDLLPPDDVDGSTPPPRADAEDAGWRAWTADALSSNWHSMGTASMMARELGGVVDARFRVYGTRGLRVVDASIMPTQLSGHPMATFYAIADRASEMFLSDAVKDSK
ncbi:glucose oxidase [Xylaria sp. FL0933]|nr:glucose oxidase [Xylaria sp. FL0933]